MSLRSRRESAGRAPRSRERCEDLVRSLDIQAPFDVEALCRSIAEQRGRPLYLHSTPGVTGTDIPCGAWLATEKADHIFHEQSTSPLHRTHIILHELGHMLLGHQSALDNSGTGISAALFPDLSPAMVTSLMKRASYNTEDERSAEYLAGLIASEADLATKKNRDRESVLQRLDDALSDT
ncbi:hypothetical protein [Streptomyces sp. NPDC002785]|uniref:hypothetical protein n=1 Tax=Streptomyces sp. NPDC002785 TaxID=3154543 RepID=UPI00331DB06F